MSEISQTKFRSGLLDYGLIVAWLAAAMIVVTLISFFVLPVRDKMLAHAVDSALARADDQRRVDSRESSWGAEGKASLSGVRFSLKEKKGGAVVFSLNGAAVAIACVAIVEPDGAVRTVLPLDPASAQNFDRLPSGLLQSYTARIETVEREVQSREKHNE